MSPRPPFFLILVMLAAGCNRTSSAPAQKSPDGTMTVSTSVNQSKANPTRYLCVVVDITDSTGKVLHHEVTPASDMQRWSIQWVSNDEALLKSSDVGNYRIRRQPDGMWKGELGAT
jgi:hypothetical protein